MDNVSSRTQTEETRGLEVDVEKRADSPEQQQTIPQNTDDTRSSLKDAGDNVSPDATIVDWDGPEDPKNPKNWPESEKWLNVVLISVLTLVT